MFGGELMKQNKTAMVIGIIYVVIAYLILRYYFYSDLNINIADLIFFSLCSWVFVIVIIIMIIKDELWH